MAHTNHIRLQFIIEAEGQAMSPKKKQQTPNHTIFTGDNLDILRGMDSESVDLIYLDPPFNSNRHYKAPIGSQAAGAEFKDAWTFEDTKEAWWGLIADEHPAIYKVIDAAGDVGSKGDKAYLIYMAMRLLEMHRILKPIGSIYLHCDDVMSHSLKMVMDAIFGRKNFGTKLHGSALMRIMTPIGLVETQILFIFTRRRRNINFLQFIFHMIKNILRIFLGKQMNVGGTA